MYRERGEEVWEPHVWGCMCKCGREGVECGECGEVWLKHTSFFLQNQTGAHYHW